MTVGHAPVPDAQEVEDRCGQRVFVGLRQQAAFVATAACTAADEVHRSTMGTTGDGALAPPSAPPPSAASRVGTV